MRRVLPLALCLSVAGAAPAQVDEDAILREAERIERSLVYLTGKVRESTVAVVRYLEVERDGATLEAPGGVGSGVALERDLVLTNVHVIEKASRLEVVLPGGKRLPASVVSEHTAFDFAVLRVKGAGLAPADFARGSGAPGQWALAAGNPQGLALDGQPVVTLGILSGRGRVAGGRFDYRNALQTDAEINPGNSGGPLFDLSGRILGVNGKIATTGARVSVGVGYALSAEQIQNFLRAMAQGGRVEPGFSGLIVKADAAGVFVAAVLSNSPAAKVGVKPGDRVLGVNGAGIDSLTSWMNQSGLLPNGRAMTLRLQRDGRTFNKRFTLEAPVRKPPPAKPAGGQGKDR